MHINHIYFLNVWITIIIKNYNLNRIFLYNSQNLKYGKRSKFERRNSTLKKNFENTIGTFCKVRHFALYNPEDSTCPDPWGLWGKSLGRS